MATPQADQVDAFLEMVHYCPLDARKDDGWDDFAAMMAQQPDNVRVFYLSTSPALFVDICDRLGHYHLNEGASRVVLEKPIGRDLASAKQINDAVGRVFSESQIFRIDHYLGKETVQNLLALRFANALFEPLWNSAHIDHVQITVAETVGVGHRAGYYDKAGALRDMVQNHLLQLLCLVAMEPPASLAPDAVRDEKLKVLHALKPIDASNAGAAHRARPVPRRRGRGERVPGYLDELGEKKSNTETFVALKAEIDNWRWAGVPFYLRTGKRLPTGCRRSSWRSSRLPHSIFDAAAGPLAQNRLVLRLQPDEGVKLWLMIKHPGPGGLRLQPRAAGHELRRGLRRAAARCLRAAAAGRGARQPDAVHAPRRGRGGMALGRSRSCRHGAGRRGAATLHRRHLGPSAAVALIERDGRTWNEESE